MAKCMICGKGPVAGHNVPKSQHKTNRMIQPNIQRVQGITLCTRCLRTMKRNIAVVEAKVASSSPEATVAS